MHTRATVIGILGAVLILAGAGTGAASTKMYVSTDYYWLTDKNYVGSVFSVNPGSAFSYEYIGRPLPSEDKTGLSGIAFDSTGNLYGSTYDVNTNNSRLLNISPVDGHLIKEVGSIRDSNNDPISMIDLAFNPKSNLLYGVSDKFSKCENCLYSIDVNKATASWIENTGAGEAGGIAFGSDGTLYMTTMSARGSRGTGDLTSPIYELWRRPPEGGVWTKEDVIREKPEYAHGQWYYSITLDGLGIGPDGSLYGTWDPDKDIVKRILINGEYKWSIIGKLPEHGTDLDFQPVPIPAPLLLLGSGLAALAVLRRRQ